jgi:2-oxoglutarate ferredoxin oxidoreductase subunit beta
MLEAGATFVARAYSGKIKEMADTIVKAVDHTGFSVIDVLQPCVTYNDTYKLYNEKVKILEKTPESYEKAMEIARTSDPLYIGIIYQTQKPVYHHELYKDFNPVKDSLSREKRIKKIKNVLKVE